MVYSVRVLLSCQCVWDCVFQSSWQMTSVSVRALQHTRAHLIQSGTNKWIMISVLAQCVLLKHAALATGEERLCSTVSTIKIIFHLLLRLWTRASAFLITYLDRSEATRCKSTWVRQKESKTNKTRPEEVAHTTVNNLLQWLIKHLFHFQSEDLNTGATREEWVLDRITYLMPENYSNVSEEKGNLSGLKVVFVTVSFFLSVRSKVP